MKDRGLGELVFNHGAQKGRPLLKAFTSVQSTAVYIHKRRERESEREREKDVDILYCCLCVFHLSIHVAASARER